jgi:hypothetical protein
MADLALVVEVDTALADDLLKPWRLYDHGRAQGTEPVPEGASTGDTTNE